jgi:hypothetical protein
MKMLRSDSDNDLLINLEQNIGNPARSALAEEGITRLGQLTKVNDKELLKLHGVGPKAVRLLREALATRGLSFAQPETPKHRIYTMKFADVYPFYVQKAERKNRTKEEVDQIICWLTGYDQTGLQQQIEQGNDFETFFAQAPAINPKRALIKGVVCGVRVEEIKDALMQKIRYLDKLVDELAKGKAIEKILRQ